MGKPELVEFCETETVEAAIKAIGDSTECGIPVWKRKTNVGFENTEIRQQRFVRILNSLDIVAFFAKSECLEDHEKALKTPVSKVVAHNNSLLRQVDPGTRLIDALEMMKHGVKRLLVRKSVVVLKGSDGVHLSTLLMKYQVSSLSHCVSLVDGIDMDLLDRHGLLSLSTSLIHLI